MSLRETIAQLISPQSPSVNDSYIETIAYFANEGNSKLVYDPAKPTSVKTTPEINRVEKALLEADYMTEPNMFNIVNKTSQMLMSSGQKLIGDENSVKLFEDFFDGIGSKGGETEWNDLLTSIIRHQLIFGDAWIEKIPAKRDKARIADLDLIDPKKMDYGKDNNNKIVLAPSGNPVGYVETLPFGYAIERAGAHPENVVVGPNQIFFNPNSIVHFKLYSVGDGFYPIGLIEPTHYTIQRKQNMEEALANAVNRTGFPTRAAKIGDPNHDPTENSIKQAVKDLSSMNYQGVIAYPYWVDVKILEANSPEKLQEHLKYYTNEIIAGSGMPKAFATGAGEETNRSTLNRQEAILKMTLKDIARRTTSTIEKYIIKPIADYERIEPVKIVWGEISVEELDGKSKRLSSYVASGLLRPDKNIEDLIRKIEDLPARIQNADNEIGDQ
jgi:hypothetical protein